MIELDPSILSQDWSDTNENNINNMITADIISLDSEAAKECINNLQANLEGLKTIKNTFVEATKNMSEEWKGEGATAYSASCAIIQGQIEAAIKNLEDEIADLKERTKALLQVDENNTGII